MTSVNFIIPLFSFCFDDLSTGESGLLQSPTINVLGSMCDLHFNNVSFTNVGALVFAAYVFRIVMFSCWIFPLLRKSCPSSSLLISFI